MTTEAGKVRRFVHMHDGMVEVLQTYGNDAIVIDFANRDCEPSDMFVHKSDYEALEKRARELEADAKRYRWLRDKASNVDTSVPMIVMVDRRGRAWATTDGFAEFFTGRIADETIDAAMAAEGEENG